VVELLHGACSIDAEPVGDDRPGGVVEIGGAGAVVVAGGRAGGVGGVETAGGVDDTGACPFEGAFDPSVLAGNHNQTRPMKKTRIPGTGGRSRTSPATHRVQPTQMTGNRLAEDVILRQWRGGGGHDDLSRD